MSSTRTTAGRIRYERRRKVLSALPMALALVGLSSRFIGQAGADSGETSPTSDYRVAQASISGAAYQNCGITASGGVKCWGYGPGGRLGDGTENSSDTPVDVVGLSGGVQAIAAGSDTTCALTSSGGAKCWGNLVGDGSQTGYSTSAVDVLGMTQGVRQIDLGGGFTCFVTTTSDVRCLGDNSWAQLGDGTRTSSSTVSTEVASLAGNVRSISTMGQATCAVLLDATVKCWGYAGYGQLGNGGYGIDSNNPYVLQPVAVTGLSSVVALAGGDRSMCALTSAGAVKCWGDNQYGQLGNGSTNSSPTPVDVVGLQSGVRTIAAGGLSMCALLYSNEVKCWGRNTEAALGLGYTSGPVSTPTTVPGLSGTITAVSSGFYYGCALNSIGELRCWGTLPGMVAQPNATLVNNFDGVQTRIITPGAVVILRDYAPTLYQTSPGVDSPVNLGVRVTTSEAGTVTKVLFAKHISNVDAHTAVIWDSTGAVLTTQAFVDETAEGWQEVTLATPVHVDAGATFTVGYSLMHTGFAYGPTFPATTVGPLTIDTGYYVYSSNPTDFPGGTVGSNYGVDFEFMVDAPSATTTVAETTTTVADTTTTTVADTTTTVADTTTTTVADTTTTVADTTTTVAATTTTVTPTTTTLAASTTTVAPTTTTTAAPTTTSAPTTTTATVTATTALASTTSVVVEPATVTTTPSAVPETTTTAPLVPETTTSVDTLPPTTVAAESLPAVPATAEEQLVLVAGLESTEVTPTEVVAAIETLIDAGISSSAATDLASSDKVLAAIEPEQAAAVFEAIPIAELSGEQLEQLASAVTSAPTAIKNTFESTIDVYGEGIDTYVPVGSVIDVGERKTLVAAMAAVSSIAAAAATAGANAGAGGGSSAPSAGSRERSS